jgi:hypothetical protein
MRPPRFSGKAGIPRASNPDMDSIIRLIAMSDGGRTDEARVRTWGRHLLRTLLKVDTTADILVDLFYDADNERWRRPKGNPNVSSKPGN